MTQVLRIAVVALCLASCHSGGGDAVGGTGPPLANPTPYSIGGSVTGLRGTGLVLENNGGDPLSVSADGSFTFATQVPSGAPYSVAVRTQPTASPQEMCSVTNGSGRVPSGAVTNVSVACRGAIGKYLYILTAANPTNLIHGFRINANTGELSYLPGSPFTDYNDGYSATSFYVDPNGRFLFTVGFSFLRGTPTSLSGYAIDSATGALKPIPGLPLRGGFIAELHPNGRQLYLHGFGGGIAAYSIHPTTGALTPVYGSPFAVGVSFATLNPAGTMMVVSGRGATGPAYVSTLSVDKADGALKLVGTADLPGDPAALAGFAFSPDGRYAYMLRLGGIVLVSIEDPSHLVVVDTPMEGRYGLFFERSGRYAYAPYYDQLPSVTSPGAVHGYRVEPWGALAGLPGTPYATNGSEPTLDFPKLTFDPWHRFVVTTTGSSSIAVFRIDPATGELTHTAGSPFIPTVGTTPGPVLFDPSGKYAYVIDYVSHSVSAYSFDSETGKFTFISSYAMSFLSSPSSIPRIAGLQ